MEQESVKKYQNNKTKSINVKQKTQNTHNYYHYYHIQLEGPFFVGIPEEVNNCVEFYAKCAEAKLLGGLQQNVLITVSPTDNDDRVLCPVV